MVQREGHVRVLDFGLAKLTGEAYARQAADTETPTLPKTDPRVVMGTTQYMSPEQARGLEVDERTDIFSLSVVLYEMVAGHRPFEGATSSHVVISILEQTPSPLFENLPQLPDEFKELNKLVSKALAKNPDERYQTIKDMAVDLRHLKRRFEAQAELEHSARPSSGSATIETARDATLRTGHKQGAAATPNVEHAATGSRWPKRGTVLVGICVVIALAAISYGLYRIISWNQQPMVISADGKYAAYIKDDGWNQRLWLRDVDALSERQLLHPPSPRISNISFTIDSKHVHCHIYNKETGKVAFYKFPVLKETVEPLPDSDMERYHRFDIGK